jgi:hypothetical protein
VSLIVICTSTEDHERTEAARTMTAEGATVLMVAAVAATLLVLFWRLVLMAIVAGGLAVFLVGLLRVVETLRSLP